MKIELPLITAIRGRYTEDGTIQQKLEINPRGVSNTITTVGKDNMVLEENEIATDKIYEGKYRIRKLKPIETFRLMGFKDEEFKKAEMVNSNSQLYKQAGNSIVVNVLEGIFSNMFANRLEENTL